eukprot:COSAG02_NODE_424_length_22575_cov_79.088361_21_plen_244_part_00
MLSESLPVETPAPVKMEDHAAPVTVMASAPPSAPASAPDKTCFPGGHPAGDLGEVGDCARCVGGLLNLVAPGAGLFVLSCIGESTRGVKYGLLFLVSIITGGALIFVATVLMPESSSTASTVLQVFAVSLLAVTFLNNLSWSYMLCSGVCSGGGGHSSQLAARAHALRLRAEWEREQQCREQQLRMQWERERPAVISVAQPAPAPPHLSELGMATGTAVDAAMHLGEAANSALGFATTGHGSE